MNSLTREVCEQALESLYDDASIEYDIEYDVDATEGRLVCIDCINEAKYLKMREPLDRLINEHFDNTPIKLNELNAENLHNESKWILASEQLPEEGRYVLVTWRKYTVNYVCTELLKRCGDEWVCDHGKLNGKVIAWMSIPNPYIGEE